ncbi:class I SAM-dependent DNA methyltransferase [Mucilaginibacter lutimaris]|uniref:site-specific DNA-methyltransferase (adenine-specific) n=1 Tax=Mucilaginibacter lutimaris TaxID=931629 RepID=A0ABW2ZKN0_9SPHI
MTGEDVIELIGLDRAIYVNSKNEKFLETESIVLSEVSEKDFGVDSIYFNTDDKGNSYPAIFLKKVNVFDDETLPIIAEVQRKIWNYKKVLFLYVYSDTEIRIYNCSERPLIKTKESSHFSEELKRIEISTYLFSDKKQLEELNKLFSRIAIDSGLVWTATEAQFIRDKIDLQRRVDKYLITSLVNTANQLESAGLKIEFIHKIILRSLFLLYLEDRGATDEKLYGQIKKSAKSYFDILEDTESTSKLYQRLEDDFNGNVFTIEEGERISAGQLQLIKKCFVSGNDNTPQSKLFDDWRLFDFSIIQIELLSEIYENFLFNTDPELKKRTGTYYTPPALVEFILNEKLPIRETEKNYNIKVLDPSCGSGIFLVESFKRLVKRYENQSKEKLTDFDKLKKLLTDNIYGIEIHPQAIKVAAFSLYLALVDNLDPKTIWQKKKHRLPNLINNPNDKSLKEQGYNLFCRDSITENKEIEDIAFDLVVGNPPFGTTDLSETVRNYCDHHGFAKEMVLPFLHKATILSPKGEIALIFNTKVLTNTGGTYQNFRKWLFNECYVEKVFNFSILRNAKKNFGGQLFGDATGPISIVFYQSKLPRKPSNKIAYYAPKTYIKSNIIEGLSIDSTDLKYLPREECQKPDTKIWKIAMWGGMNDWELIQKIQKKSISLEEYFDNNKWVYARGINSDSQNPDFVPEKVISAKLIERYYTSENASKINHRAYRNIDRTMFNPPFVLMKEGQHKKQLAASYIDHFSYCTTSCYVFNGNVEPNLKKGLVSILNSKLTTYFLFLTSSSWGIERERVLMNEVLESPALLPLLNDKALNDIIKLFDGILLNKKSGEFFSEFDAQDVENRISSILIDNILDSPIDGKITVSDCLEFSLDLFENKEKSKAVFPVLKEHIMAYSETISAELNDFLEGESLFANATVFVSINRSSPLMMIKLSFAKTPTEVIKSKEFIDNELKKLDKHLWKKKSTNIYFRKKLNYKIGDDIYIIRPNQRRFWSKSMAIEDASDLVLEILNEN